MSSPVWKRKPVEQDDIVSTPEGDNEFGPDQPVGPVEGLQVPNGNAPTNYDWDKPVDVGPDHSNPDRPGHNSTLDAPHDHTAKETVDKLSIGQILT